MAKKNQRQQQKRVQKKREKRRTRAGSPPGRVGHAASEVSLGFLEAAWKANPLPLPPSLERELAEFDQLAEAWFTGEQLPARYELAADLGDRMQRIVDEELFRSIGTWLVSFCDTPQQRQRAEQSFKAIPDLFWPYQHTVLKFLLTHWGLQLPAGLSRWLPLWIGLFSTLQPFDWGEEREPGSVEWASVAGLLRDYARFQAWTLAPAELIQPYATAMVERWAKRLNASNDHVIAILQSLPEQLSEFWEEFVQDPETPDWLLHLCESLDEADAYALLLEYSSRHPEYFDVHEHLANLALQLEKPREIVAGHAQRGLEELGKQPEEAVVDPQARDEFAERLRAYLA